MLDDLLAQVVSVLLGRGGGQVGGGPQVGGQEGGGLGEGVVHSHGQVTSGSRVTSGGGVDVLNTSHGQQLLGDEGGHNAGSTRSRDESASDGAALAGHLARHGVRSTRVQAPVSTADGDKVHLGVDDTATDGGGNLLGGLDTKSDVAVSVTDSDVALEASALTSGGLLLDRHDLHDLVSQSRAQKVIHDLVLLDGEGEKEDLLNRLDLAILDQAAKLGNRDPLLLVTLVTSASSSASATASAAILVTASKNENPCQNKLSSPPGTKIPLTLCHRDLFRNHLFLLLQRQPF